MPSDPYGKEALQWVTTSEGSNTLPSSPRAVVLPILGIGGLLLVLLLTLVVPRDLGLAARDATLRRPADRGAGPTVSPTPVMATPTPQPVTLTPACGSAAKELAVIRWLEQKNHWDAVISKADDTLARSGLCDHDRGVLEAKAMVARLQVLLAQKPQYLDVPSQAQMVTRYRYLKQQAHAGNIPFPTHLEVAQQAKARDHALLAKVAFEEAYTAGEFTKADSLPMRQYIDTLYRLGWWLAQGAGSVRQAGLRYLVASHALDVETGVAQGLAWAELQKYCNVEARTCPEPAVTPLLVSRNDGGIN